jgi:nucleoside-diphosphate-sugar epimerase
MKKILITGAAGFIGSNLVEYLLSQGVMKNSLRLFIMPSDSLENLPSTDFDIVRGDIRNKTVVKKAMKGVNTVYHLAAVSNVSDGSYFSVNVDGTKNLLEACKGKNIKKFIYFSSVAVYGLPAYAGEQVNISERTSKNPIGEYAESKYMAELEVIAAHKKWNIPYSIIRPTTVYGPRDRAGIFQLIKAIKGHYYIQIGDGSNRVDYVYVRDLVKGAFLAERSKRNSSEYILGAGKPITFKQLTAAVGKAINIEVSNFYVSKTIGLILANIISIFSTVFRFKVLLSTDRVKVMTTSYYFDCEKAKKELGYKATTSMTKGAKATAEWLMSHRIL